MTQFYKTENQVLSITYYALSAAFRKNNDLFIFPAKSNVSNLFLEMKERTHLDDILVIQTRFTLSLQ